MTRPNKFLATDVEVVTMNFLSANWLWILLIGFMVWMHVGHLRGHGGHSGHSHGGSAAEEENAAGHRHGC